MRPTRRWIPIALCCLPGLVAAGLVALGLAAGGTAWGNILGSPLGSALGAVFAMTYLGWIGWMSWRMMRRPSPSRPTRAAAECCEGVGPVPSDESIANGERLALLIAQREHLEARLAQLSARRVDQ